MDLIQYPIEPGGMKYISVCNRPYGISPACNFPNTSTVEADNECPTRENRCMMYYLPHSHSLHAQVVGDGSLINSNGVLLPS
jgi:hypothetical protein